MWTQTYLSPLLSACIRSVSNVFSLHSSEKCAAGHLLWCKRKPRFFFVCNKKFTQWSEVTSYDLSGRSCRCFRTNSLFLQTIFQESAQGMMINQRMCWETTDHTSLCFFVPLLGEHFLYSSFFSKKNNVWYSGASAAAPLQADRPQRRAMHLQDTFIRPQVKGVSSKLRREITKKELWIWHSGEKCSFMRQ